MRKTLYIIAAIACGFVFATIGLWLLGLAFKALGVIFTIGFKSIGFAVMLVVYYFIGKFVIDKINQSSNNLH